MKKIIFTGGGTGGHIMPNIALIENLKRKYDCKYIGSFNSMEEKLMKDKLPFFGITTCKLKRSLSLSNLLIPVKLMKGIIEAKKILKEEKPNLVFSKGGYVSVPVVIACKQLKIPVVSHESDYSMGLANKLTKSLVAEICTSFPETAKTVKNGTYTGSSIRNDIFCGNKQNISKKFYLDKKLPTLLIVGGSLGSKNINNYIQNNIETLVKKFNVLHVAGKNNTLKSKFKNYHIFDFVDRIEDLYATADFVVTRGGSNMIFEILALRKPMLIIPLSKGSRGDQIENAKEFEQKNYAKVLLEEEIKDDSSLFMTTLNSLINEQSNMLSSMQNAPKNGTENIIKVIERHIK